MCPRSGVRGPIGFDKIQNSIQERLLHRFMYDEPRARSAHLSLVEEYATDNSSRCGVQIATAVQDNVSRLATAFETDILEVALPGIAHEILADFRRSREEDAVNILMQADGAPGIGSHAWNNIENAIRNSRFLGQSSKAQRRKARLFGRLENDRVARGQCRCRFHAAMISGKFHGTTAATTPSGSRVMVARTSAAVGATSP